MGELYWMFPEKPRGAKIRPFRSESELQTFVRNNPWILGTKARIIQERRSVGQRKMPDFIAVVRSGQKRKLVVAELKPGKAKAGTLGQIYEYCDIVSQNPSRIEKYLDAPLGDVDLSNITMMIVAEGIHDELYDLVRHIKNCRWELVEISRFKENGEWFTYVNRRSPPSRRQNPPADWPWHLCKRIWRYNEDEIRKGKNLLREVRRYTKAKAWKLGVWRPVTDVYGLGEWSFSSEGSADLLGIGPTVRIQEFAGSGRRNGWYVWFSLSEEPEPCEYQCPAGRFRTHWMGEGKYFFVDLTGVTVHLDDYENLFIHALERAGEA